MPSKLAFACAALLALTGASSAQTVVVYAAGSLRPPFLEVGDAFKERTGLSPRFEFGASGLLKDPILAGKLGEVFASANIEHPRALVEAGKGERVVVFARNQICALIGPSVVANRDLLAIMLDPAVKLGTSTPKADPSGDYAWEVFHNADTIKPGSFDALSGKALQLTGGPNSPPPPNNRTVYGAFVAEGTANFFLTYCTNATLAAKQDPQLRIIDLPPQLAVGAEYGVTVIKGAPLSASQFVDFLRGPDGQSVLRKFGFR